MRITFPQLTKKRLRWLLEYPATSPGHIAHIGEDVEYPADEKPREPHLVHSGLCDLYRVQDVRDISRFCSVISEKSEVFVRQTAHLQLVANFGVSNAP
jgi:hypothetical protein